MGLKQVKETQEKTRDREARRTKSSVTKTYKGRPGELIKHAFLPELFWNKETISSALQFLLLMDSFICKYFALHDQTIQVWRGHECHI